MGNQEHLLLNMMEECAGVQLACSKALRFGLEDYNPNTSRRNNAENIAYELIGILAIRDMLLHNKVIPPTDDKIKKEKLKKEHPTFY